MITITISSLRVNQVDFIGNILFLAKATLDGKQRARTMGGAPFDYLLPRWRDRTAHSREIPENLLVHDK